MHIITGILLSTLLGRKNLFSGQKETKPIGFHNLMEVRHFLPGRIRLFAPIIKNAEPESVSKSIETLKKVEGIEVVTATPLTGSILVQFDKELLEPELIIAGLIKILGLQEELEKRPSSLIGTELDNASESLNRALYEKSIGTIDLWTLIPLILAGIGIFKLLKPGGLVLPGGFTLLWWAYAALFGRRGN